MADDRELLLDTLARVIFFAAKLPANRAVSVAELRAWQRAVALGGVLDPVLCICGSFGSCGETLANCPSRTHEKRGEINRAGALAIL